MFTWFIDDPTLVWAVLGIAALILGVLWWRYQSKTLLTAVLAVAVLFGLSLLPYFLLDSDARRIRRAVEAMADGAASRDTAQVFAHISDSFRIGTMDKQAFRARVSNPIATGEAGQIHIWDYRARHVSRDQRRATVTFSAKGSGPDARGVEWYNVRAEFVLDPDGQWRLQTFELFLPHVDPMQGQPVSLPF